METPRSKAVDTSWPETWMRANRQEMAIRVHTPRIYRSPSISFKTQPNEIPRTRHALRVVPTRAVVVDDDPTIRKIASRLLAAISNIKVIGEASSGQEALDVVNQLRPDLVLMDIQMPGMDGLEATRRLFAGSQAPSIILMSTHDLTQYRDAAKTAGAHDFIVKSDLGSQLARIVETLSPGRNPLDDVPRTSSSQESTRQDSSS